MTFINAGILTALFAAAIPLLIHLFSRQRFKEMDFSSLKFLKRLQKKRMRKVRIAEWLLILLRTLAVAALVVAFARPAFVGKSGFLPGEAHTAAVLLIDNSLASQAASTSGSILSEQRQRAVETLNLFTQEDRLTIITTAQPIQLVTPQPLSGDDERIRRHIFDIVPTEAAADWNRALEEAIRFLQNSEQTNREIYLFSPFFGNYDELDSALAKIPQEIKIFRLPSGPQRLNNVSITGVNIETQIVQVGGAVTLAMTVRNFSDIDYKELNMSLYVEQERVASAIINLPAESEAQAKLQFIPKHSGFISGRVKLEIEDELEADNRRFFALYVPDKVNVFLVGDSTEVSTVFLALKPSEQHEYAVNPQIIGSLMELSELDEAGVIFYLVSENLSTYNAGLLRRKLETGAGVIISPSQKMDASEINRLFLQPLGAPQFANVVSSEGISWSFIDWQHPIFQGIFSGEPDLASPVFRRYFRLAGGEGSDIIDFRGNVSYLQEVRLGKGHLLIFSAGFADYWGDIAKKGIFAPLVHRAVVYLGSKRNGGTVQITAGTPLEHYSEPSSDRFTLEKPDGAIVELLPKAAGSSILLSYINTGITGIYRLNKGSELKAAVAVNPDLAGLTFHKPEMSKSDFSITIEREADLARAVQLQRLGNEIWRTFLILTILCLTAESFICRVMG